MHADTGQSIDSQAASAKAHVVRSRVRSTSVRQPVFCRANNGYKGACGCPGCFRITSHHASAARLTLPLFEVLIWRSNSKMRTPFVDSVGAAAGLSAFCTASARKFAIADLPACLGPTIRTLTSVILSRRPRYWTRLLSGLRSTLTLSLATQPAPTQTRQVRFQFHFWSRSSV